MPSHVIQLFLFIVATALFVVAAAIGSAQPWSGRLTNLGLAATALGLAWGSTGA